MIKVGVYASDFGKDEPQRSQMLNPSLILPTG